MANNNNNRTNANAGSRNRAKLDDSILPRTGRTIRDRPYTSAAIATGAVTVAAALAAGAFFFTRRDKSFKEAGNELSGLVKDSFTGASDRVKGIAERGAGYFKADEPMRSQQVIAQEAMQLKEAGAQKPIDELTVNEIKAGTVAY